MSEVEEREIPLDELGTRLATLRLPAPELEQELAKSMVRYGQTSALVVYEDPEEGFQLLDGFKRLKAARAIGLESVRVRILKLERAQAKVALLTLNWSLRKVSDLEEAWVLHNLHRVDGLSQVEIARLLGRHKSFVSRRIALVERLSEELSEQLRLGLLGPTMARELARLPRGNQEEVLEVVRSQELGTREASQLIEAFNNASEKQKPWVLSHPMEAISNRSDKGPRNRDPRLSEAVAALVDYLRRVEGVCGGLKARLTNDGIPEHTETEREVLINKLKTTHVLQQILGHVLNKAIVELENGSRSQRPGASDSPAGPGPQKGSVQPQAGPQVPDRPQPGS